MLWIKASNNIGHLEDVSIELFGFSVFVHSGQNVCHNVCLPRHVVNGKIEFLESVQPSDLAGGRFDHGSDLFQRGAVGVDDDRQPVQIMTPLGGRFHESQKFFLVNRVVDVVLIELSGHTNYEAQQFNFVLLAEHGSHSGVRGVGVQDVGLVPGRECEDDVTYETFLQLLEGSLFRGSPVPDFLSVECGKRRSDGGELLEELVIETTKAEE